MTADFDRITAWVFDLDNTLYPPSARLFDAIEARMTAFVMREIGLPRAEADALRRQYWRTHGTTLAGLMREHGIAPGPYLTEVHDIPLDALRADPALAAGIAALPGRRIVHTNASRPYAERVLAACGLAGLFDAVYGIEEAGFHPKPDRAAFEAVFAADRLSPASAAIFEDDPRNLAAPHAMGLRTVLVAPAPDPAAHIHHHTADLAAFLARIAA
jgi:putative hydrolase of the HAD superfamily